MHRHLHAVPPPSDADTLDRAHVGVVAPPGDRDVEQPGLAVVRRVDVEPAGATTPGGEPGVGGVGPHHAGVVGSFAGRAVHPPLVAEIAAHVAGREAEGAQAGDLEVGEVLANAAAMGEDLLHGRARGGGGGVVDEVAVDSPGEIHHRLGPRAAGRERLPGPLGQLRRPANEWRVEYKLAGGDRLGRGRGCDFIADRLPRHRRELVPRPGRIDGDAARGRHHEPLVPLLDGEAADLVAEVVGRGGDPGRGGIDLHRRGQQPLPRQRPGHEVDLVVADGHRLRIGVDRRVPHVVPHGGRCRAVLVCHEPCPGEQAIMPSRPRAADCGLGRRCRGRRRPTRRRAAGDRRGRACPCPRPGR